jgi:DNA-binding PadR family transcriptional regulator
MRLNHLQLTALQLLHERPMHPYEMSRLINERRIDSVLNLKRGSLYHAVERLARDGLIAALETSREGRRPERTVYRLTDEGRDTFDSELRELITDYRYEPPRFMAGAQFISSLPPQDAAKLLRLRAVQLEEAVAAHDAVLNGEKWPDYKPVHVVEREYAKALAAAELEWVRKMVRDIESGTLTWDAPTTQPALRVVS